MKILNTKFGRQAIAAALILSAMASMSLGAFAAEPSAETAADEAVVAREHHDPGRHRPAQQRCTDYCRA